MGRRERRWSCSLSGVVTEVVKEEEKSQEKSQEEEEEEDERQKEELVTREHELLVSKEVEREARKVEEARNAVIKAQLDMMEKDELIRRCVMAGH